MRSPDERRQEALLLLEDALELAAWGNNPTPERLGIIRDNIREAMRRLRS